ncbi:hypothetical protein SEUCBS140593_010817 [Sporothrix eucalyptigena]|uniref:Exonuclease V n=1 Tax=Sporothrix eucalyptigena TaxID=1812306 RepID=A0ABP0D627_9PEZI
MPVAGSDSNNGQAAAAEEAGNPGSVNGQNGVDDDIDFDTEFGSDIDLDNESDYGWDLSFDEDALKLLNAAAPTIQQATQNSSSLPTSRTRLLVPAIPSGDPSQRNAVFSQSLGGPLVAADGVGVVLPHQDPVADDDDPSAAAVLDAAVLGFEAAYPDLSQIVTELTGEHSDDDFATSKDKWKAVAPEAAETAESTLPGSPPANSKIEGDSLDQSSPIAKFRTAPKKPLSVSDLTAGAWCELQYEYTLTRLPGGRRTRTPAMKAGTKLHQKLEQEVHTIVPIAATSSEDFIALRIVNMIQGLRTLRETGLTREFDIWGIIDLGVGDDDSRYQVVNGVIDALSFQNPDPGYVGHPAQKKLPTGKMPVSAATSFNTDTTASTNSRITDYFPSGELTSEEGAEHDEIPFRMRKVYVSDVKTRESSRLPTGASARPSKIQLFLYHRFLCDLAARRLSFVRIFKRFNVHPNLPLSQMFLADLSGQEILGNYNVPSACDINGFLDILDVEIAKTFPRGEDSVGNLVANEYRQRPPEGESMSHGRCLGTIVVPVDKELLDRYLANYMGWWRGARPAAGVDIEDAGFKCRYCEFANDCDWREKMDQERIEKARAKVAAARAARGQ